MCPRGFDDDPPKVTDLRSLFSPHPSGVPHHDRDDPHRVDGGQDRRCRRPHRGPAVPAARGHIAGRTIVRRGDREISRRRRGPQLPGPRLRHTPRRSTGAPTAIRSGRTGAGPVVDRADEGRASDREPPRQARRHDVRHRAHVHRWQVGARPRRRPSTSSILPTARSFRRSAMPGRARRNAPSRRPTVRSGSGEPSRRESGLRC